MSLFSVLGGVAGFFVGGPVGALVGASAGGQYQAGVEQSNALKRQAEQEKIAATGRELQRRMQLKKVLETNAVSQAQSGVSGEGTPASIALSNARNISISESALKLSDVLKQAEIKRRAKAAKSQGVTDALGTIMQGYFMNESLKDG